MVLGVKYWDKWKTNGFKFQVLRYLKTIDFPFGRNRKDNGSGKHIRVKDLV